MELAGELGIFADHHFHSSDKTRPFAKVGVQVVVDVLMPKYDFFNGNDEGPMKVIVLFTRNDHAVFVVDTKNF